MNEREELLELLLAHPELINQVFSSLHLQEYQKLLDP